MNRLAYATARSRLPMNGKNGSAEHLYELIRVCLLMQRHKDFILAQKRLIANAQGELRFATLQTNAAFAQAKHQIIAIVVEIRGSHIL